MEPLKPEMKRKLLEAQRQATPADIEEYERLLAERFTLDPDLPQTSIMESTVNAKEARLAQLHKLLFGTPP